MTRARAIAFAYGCRLIIPLWVLAGASFKLAERNPKLLPAPVLEPVLALGSALGLTGVEWLDNAMRAIIFLELALAAIMLAMPRLARVAAIVTLVVFCAVLFGVLVPAFRSGGLEGALKGSCGCFGQSGPNPLLMLAIDLTLLVAAILAKRSAIAAPVTASTGLPRFAILVGIGLIPLILVPARAAIDLEPPPERGPTAQQATSPSIATPVAAPWPPRPAQAAPYYIPEFATWTGTRLDAQEMVRLIDPGAPEGLNSGTWFVMFYREDCEHCHELLAEHFSGTLATPTLTIAIPDTDPAASLEMPCGECQQRRLVKGPEYVLTTPVLMRVEDGVITRMAADHEDRDSIARCLAP